MSNISDPFNLLTVANSVGTVGLAYWTIPTIKKLAAVIDDLHEEVKLMKEENARRHNDQAVSLAALQRIGSEIKAIKDQVRDFDCELVNLKIETLEDGVTSIAPDFEPFEYKKKRQRRSMKSRKSSRSRKIKEETSSSELSDSSEEELVMRGSKKGKSDK